jgi:D-aminoacyl-tRNA deacylase
MRAVIQRVSKATVTVGSEIKASIGPGLLILLGIEHHDTEDDALWLSKKIEQLRIFNDNSGVMNLSVGDVGGKIIVVSQFTLHALTRKGNRPSYIHAARPEQAVPLYEYFVKILSTETGKPVQTGEFGAMMEVLLINDGPVTLIIDTKNKE